MWAHRYWNALFFRYPVYAFRSPFDIWNNHRNCGFISVFRVFISFPVVYPYLKLNLSLFPWTTADTNVLSAHVICTICSSLSFYYVTTEQHLSNNVLITLSLCCYGWFESSRRYWFVWIDLLYTNNFTVQLSFLATSVSRNGIFLLNNGKQSKFRDITKSSWQADDGSR